ncbi:hypothetical protein ASPCAL05413 [Aspergillus calidoustus]|uniref:F-box domain-containing protein n=1 Tax=Aspergillus calidoustus TaxID=454130 RepID=A0A0U5FXN5_ASPCI|nr:hypothetical protein ASPCAL05413 [Aspergillus calidoustus]
MVIKLQFLWLVARPTTANRIHKTITYSIHSVIMAELSDLPAELLRLVASHIDDHFQSLKQLRLASHSLSAAATPSLFQRHYVSPSRDPRVMGNLTI